MEEPRIVLIGCGAVARRYYVPALKRHPGIVRKVYLADARKENALETRALLGGGVVVEDYREAFSRALGAIVMLPNHLHHRVVMDCIGAGLHVLCEKPLATDPGHAREMVFAAKEIGVFLCVNNTRRLFPSFRAVRDAIASGDLGRLRRIDYTEGALFGWPSLTGFYVDPSVSPRGVLLDVGAHAADTLCWWLGGCPEVDEVRDDSYGGPESVVRVRARRNGCEINLYLSRLSELQSSYRVEGDRGSAEGGVFDWKRVRVSDGSGSRTLKLACPVRNYPGFVGPVLENFLAVVRCEQKPLVTGADVLDSLDFIDQCYRERKRLEMPWDIRVRSRFAPAAAGPRAEDGGRRILVTGATGFIGGRVVEAAHLAGDGFGTVLAGLHRTAAAARLGRFPVRAVRLDLMDQGGLEDALEGVTHVIHCAKGTPQVTVDGTVNLLDACLKKGVSHFIHLSSADVYGEVSGVVKETSPYRYTGNPYNQMKIDSERLCWLYQDRGLPITVFRPSIVYGPFSAGWSLRFAAMFLAGEGGVYEGIGEGTCNLVYVDDLVRTMLAALDDEGAKGRAFNVNGPEIVSWNEYFRRLNASLGLPELKVIGEGRAGALVRAMEPVRSLGGLVKRRFLGPVKAVAERVGPVDALMRSLEHRAKTTPSSDELRLFSRDVLYSDELARSTLPCCPDTDLEQGLAGTREWVRYLGLIS